MKVRDGRLVNDTQDLNGSDRTILGDKVQKIETSNDD